MKLKKPTKWEKIEIEVHAADEEMRALNRAFLKNLDNCHGFLTFIEGKRTIMRGEPFLYKHAVITKRWDGFDPEQLGFDRMYAMIAEGAQSSFNTRKMFVVFAEERDIDLFIMACPYRVRIASPDDEPMRIRMLEPEPTIIWKTKEEMARISDGIAKPSPLPNMLSAFNIPTQEEKCSVPSYATTEDGRTIHLPLSVRKKIEEMLAKS